MSKDEVAEEVSQLNQKLQDDEVYIKFFPISYDEVYKHKLQFIEETEVKRNKNWNHNLKYKVGNPLGNYLVELLLLAHGFQPIKEGEEDWNIWWAANGIRALDMKPFKINQKVNHFPRTSEICRKDFLFLNISKVSKFFEDKSVFGFLPQTFLLPGDFQKACEAVSSNSNDACWIKKPVDGSQGKGVFVINKSKPLKEKECLISKYIDNPLLINGFKFDIRVYVLISSFDPLVIYTYEDGLCRFATEKYRSAHETYNRFVHLTNYSVNKLNEKFTINTDSPEGDTGNKWSFSSLKKYLSKRQVDPSIIFSQIYGIIIKTILAIKPIVNQSIKKNLSHDNCFELLGFDILIDDQLKAWLLEVNLSPSLNCDSGLDHRIKCSMMCDLFNLVGIRKDSIYDKKNKRQIEEMDLCAGGWKRIYPSNDHTFLKIEETIEINIKTKTN